MATLTISPVINSSVGFYGSLSRLQTVYINVYAVGGGVIGNTGVGCNRVQMSLFITG